jgi:hypothetical protein
MMQTFEIVLMPMTVVSGCPKCTERVLGTVQADSPYKAKRQAELLWPDACYEQMMARHVTTTPSIPPGEEQSPVEQYI